MEKVVTIILIVMIALVSISIVLGLTWVYSPTEFTFSFEFDNATLDTMNKVLEVYENQSEYEDFIDEALDKYSGGLE